jgi:exosome complex RNA-binding protein Rrp42 (RNase PH superfamily)
MSVRSRTIPLSSLCICPRKAVWALYIDVVCINYDGNAFDAAVLAVMAALRSSEFAIHSQLVQMRLLADHQRLYHQCDTMKTLVGRE